MEQKREKRPKTFLDGSDLGRGVVVLRQGILVTGDGEGGFTLRAPRRADEELAKRVVATMAGANDDVSKALVANLTSIREET